VRFQRIVLLDRILGRLLRGFEVAGCPPPTAGGSVKAIRRRMRRRCEDT